MQMIVKSILPHPTLFYSLLSTCLLSSSSLLFCLLLAPLLSPSLQLLFLPILALFSPHVYSWLPSLTWLLLSLTFSSPLLFPHFFHSHLLFTTLHLPALLSSSILIPTSDSQQLISSPFLLFLLVFCTLSLTSSCFLSYSLHCLPLVSSRLLSSFLVLYSVLHFPFSSLITLLSLLLSALPSSLIFSHSSSVS